MVLRVFVGAKGEKGILWIHGIRGISGIHGVTRIHGINWITRGGCISGILV